MVLGRSGGMRGGQTDVRCKARPDCQVKGGILPDRRKELGDLGYKYIRRLFATILESRACHYHAIKRNFISCFQDLNK